MLRPAPRRGVTLIELVVALAVLTTAALLVPAVRPPALRAESSATSVAGVIANARREAVRRAGTMHLTIATSGAWRLEDMRRGPVVGGALPPEEAPTHSIGLAIDMLGSCRPDATSGAIATPVAPLDLHRCAAGFDQ